MAAWCSTRSWPNTSQLVTSNEERGFAGLVVACARTLCGVEFADMNAGWIAHVLGATSEHSPDPSPVSCLLRSTGELR